MFARDRSRALLKLRRFTAKDHPNTLVELCDIVGDLSVEFCTEQCLIKEIGAYFFKRLEAALVNTFADYMCCSVEIFNAIVVQCLIHSNAEVVLASGNHHFRWRFFSQY